MQAIETNLSKVNNPIASYKDLSSINELNYQEINSKSHFGFSSSFKVTKLKGSHNLVAEIDKNYCFDKDLTNAILAAFMFNKKTIVTGLHGSGKSTHIEQVAARLNWPCIRINLDGQISRSDLLGRDVIKIKNNKQVTEFQEGLLIYALKNPVALILDEYDAGKADVMFVLQRILEQEGKLTLLEKNEIIKAHKHFRIFATCNTLGSGDEYGIYHGTSFINQGQLDRWDQIVQLDFLEPNLEVKLLKKKFKNHVQVKESLIKDSVSLANLIRDGFKQEELSSIISTRTLISFIDNYTIYESLSYAFRVSIYNRYSKEEKQIVAELFQKVFAIELT